MVTVYFSFIRSILEQSCVLWHSTLTEEDRMSLEQVQKNALRNILKEKYETYENALEVLNIETLYKRREKLIRTFGRKCLQLDQTKELFPFNKNIPNIKTRNHEKFQILHANTERLKNSTVPYIQRILNQNEKIRNA